ncbi:Crp/Fnr family transcriptional regulator [Umezawaea sp. Da 62-37]|uniref:Crp/Fnr family transcriptional regulator n=1 Tax=Umezawaea sp. Da 62-37 TaxID=3075927 RepID=UPI0028F70E72|nr:Crp/Fnr family transcriptional regulator [Umezawaea sp. Da 62-37]WNV85330.1 Crp/Fnr family transcriptional regulator [Umezawaea sp. Da 62-37]
MIAREQLALDFWSRLDTAARTAITKAARVVKYRKGQILIKVSAKGTWLAVLHEGRVRVMSPDGNRIIATRSAGAVVGDQALIDNKVRSATVQAETDVVVYVLGEAAFAKLVADHPHVMRVLYSMVSERLRQAHGAMSDQADNALTKVVRHLLRHPAVVKRTSGRDVSVRITSQTALGDRLGLSRASVARALEKLRGAGLVTTERGVVTVRNVATLRSWERPTA